MFKSWSNKSDNNRTGANEPIAFGNELTVDNATVANSPVFDHFGVARDPYNLLLRSPAQLMALVIISGKQSGSEHALIVIS